MNNAAGPAGACLPARGLSRRDLLLASAGGLSLLAAPPAPAAPRTASLSLRAGAFQHEIVPGRRSDVWGFNGSLPGPVLRLRRGDTALVEVTNALPRRAATTVHWHGIRLPNAMDGVPQVTQDPIAPGERFTYQFAVPDAGTFWYHPHQMSYEQVARGMFGALVVEEDKPLAVDREVLWMLGDFKLDARGRQVDDFGRLQDLGGGGRLGNVLTVDGRHAGAATRLVVRSGERIRLRLVNTATARVFLLDFRGQQPLVVAYDGQPVEPHPLPQGLLLLGPGMRTDLVLDCDGAAGDLFPVIDRRDQGHRIATIAYERKPALRARPLRDPVRLDPNELAEPDPSRATQHFLVVEGGLLGKPAIGIVDGQPLKLTEIMRSRGLSWTMNYLAEHEHAMLHAPLFTFRRGEHVVLKMVNETEFEHPMHLHGHSFRVLRVNDRATRHREWRDTVMVSPRGSVDIAFVADNPGEWMFHCHILEHAAGGMMGTVAVE